MVLSAVIEHPPAFFATSPFLTLIQPGSTILCNQRPGGEQMSSGKTQHDAVNNERFEDIYVHASQEPWVQWYPGIGLKLLRATQETGHWTILINCSKGSSFPRHEHLGA